LLFLCLIVIVLMLVLFGLVLVDVTKLTDFLVAIS
jgi:hypothetical protein